MIADKLVMNVNSNNNNNNNSSSSNKKQKIFDSPAPIMKDLMVHELQAI